MKGILGFFKDKELEEDLEKLSNIKETEEIISQKEQARLFMTFLIFTILYYIIIVYPYSSYNLVAFIVYTSIFFFISLSLFLIDVNYTFLTKAAIYYLYKKGEWDYKKVQKVINAALLTNGLSILFLIIVYILFKYVLHLFSNTEERIFIIFGSYIILYLSVIEMRIFISKKALDELEKAKGGKNDSEE